MAPEVFGISRTLGALFLSFRREAGSIRMRDFFGRELNYVRISVTDRCNYRCRYCMPREGVEWIPHGRIMSYEDIFFLIRALRGLGVGKVRFTGGEPLVRKGMIPFLAKVCAEYPDLHIALTTNGSTLFRHAGELVRMGLSAINISLDTVAPEKFFDMTRGGSLTEVLTGIDALLDAGALDAGMTVRMNAVVMRDFNAGETGNLIDFARSKNIVLRFIEFMPMDQNVWSGERFVPFREILDGLPDAAVWKPENTERNALAGPARYYVNANTGQRVGIISAVSQHFCALCNRLRITATGEARACLFSNSQVSILEALRSRDGAALQEGLFRAAGLKPEVGVTSGFSEWRSMSKIGG